PPSASPFPYTTLFRSRRPAHRQDRPLPQRHHRDRRPGAGGADQEPRRSRARRGHLVRDGRPLRDAAGGDAGPGDDGRHRRAAGGGPADRRDLRQHGAPYPAARADAAGRRGGTFRRGRAGGGSEGGRIGRRAGRRRGDRPRAGRGGRRTRPPYRAGTHRTGDAGRSRSAVLRAEPARRRRRPGRTVRTGRATVRAGGRVKAKNAPALRIDPILDDPATRIVICCGSGGVGKTTTAAALGMRAAERGRTVVVLTVDPARRLAQSMGLTELDNTPRPVPGVEGDGALYAMMLDMKRTFDEIIEAHADPERARQILTNPFYQSLSSNLAGTQEYMAMEKLGQLHRTGEWDLIIVDTP